MEAIKGRWELVSSEKYDEFLKAAGVGMIQRNIASKAQPTVEFLERDGKIVQKTSTTFKSFEIVFVSGEEFDEDLADGRKSKSVITIDGNKLVHIQNTGNARSEVTRIFEKKEMLTTFKCGDVLATRRFKRIN